MPAEIEVPTEHLHEVVHEEHHKSSHGHGPGKGDPFTLYVALSSAVLAVLAAAAALFAGHHANEATIDRVRASDKWSYYQAKSIKANLLQTKVDLLKALEKPVSADDEAKATTYGQEKNEIEAEARAEEQSSQAHLDKHNALARSVTFFQVAIALGAISVLTRRRSMWFGSLAVGVAGVVFMALGFSMAIPEVHGAAGEKPAAHGAAHPGNAEH